MFRPKEQTQPHAYTFVKDGQAFTVALFHEHNTPSGCPRFRAVITWTRPEDKDTGARVYTFRGSYLSPIREAEEILLYMLGGWKK